MRCIQVFAVLAVGLLTLAQTHGGNAKKDQDKLKGAWQVTEIILDGKPEPEARKAIKISFSGDTMKLTGPGGKREYTFKLDPAKKAKAIDLVPQDGPFKGKLAPGIYEVDGDTLKLCLANRPEAKRPKEFKAPEGSKQGLFIMKRAKQ